MKISAFVKASLLASATFGAYIESSRSLTTPKVKPVLPAENYPDTILEDTDVSTVENDTDESEEPIESTDSSSDDLSEYKIPVQCTQGNYEISSAAELAQLHTCEEILGSIFIKNYDGATLETGDIKSISGDFVVTNASNLVRINTPRLAVIGGNFVLNELTSLTSVYAPYLNTIGIVEWKVLPILSTVNFDSGIKRVKSITISDTSLTAFNGFDSEVLDTLNINNNRFLETISTGLKGINEKLSISANARNIAVSFPKLEYANNITIRDVSALDLNNIVAVNKSLELINNSFQALKFPKLKNVGGTLSLIENNRVRDVEFPQVEEISGGLMVINNTHLNKLNFFPKLTSVGGAIKFIGDFRDATFSKLKVIKGSALIDTGADGFDCSKWTKREGDQYLGSIIRGGSIVCRSSGKEQTVKYNNDGEIVDESISIIDGASDLQKSESGYTGSAPKNNQMGTLMAFAIALWFALMA